jgi:hypothetical protein
LARSSGAITVLASPPASAPANKDVAMRCLVLSWKKEFSKFLFGILKFQQTLFVCSFISFILTKNLTKFFFILEAASSFFYYFFPNLN